jgi:hypothetical protein
MRSLRITARLSAWLQTAAETRPGFWMLSVITLPAAAAVVAALFIIYRLVDPLPPHGFEFAAGIAGSGYDNVARRYAQILARDGVELKIRNSAGAVENLELLRSTDSRVQAALSTLGFAQGSDAAALDSLGGVFDAVIFIFYKTPSRSRSSRNSAASAFPSARRERAYARWFCVCWRQATPWILPPTWSTSTMARVSTL